VGGGLRAALHSGHRVPEVDPLDPQLPAKRTGVINRYHNALHATDALIGQLLGALKEAGVDDQTVVAITGDHGESFWDDGTMGHSTRLSPAQLHVPLILHVPGRPAERLTHVTSHVDVMPTLFELAGLTLDPALYSDGGSIFQATGRPALVASMSTSEPERFALVTAEELIHFRQTGGMLELGEREPFDRERRSPQPSVGQPSIVAVLRHLNRWWPATEQTAAAPP
jgi:membrane-anchored protein YejM (alkaline phosphatase superfamily)